MTSEKMLYVKSNDYWGYDAADFDSNLNFYTYTWTVPQSMYNDMDDSDQGRLFPCALFYVQGVTDNHNFLTLTIDVTGSDAKVRGMQGAKRRTLKFETGVPYAYSVGSLNMKEAPAGSTTIASIEEAVKDGSATMTGVFNVDAFLTDASAIAEVVGLSTTSSAESFEAEVSDFYPQSSAEIGDEQSGRGVPVAYGSGSSQYVEPPVVELSAEVSDFYPQSSAEIGDEQSGRGVPVAYGSGSSQYVEPPVRMGAEEDGFTYAEEDFIPNSYGEDSALTSGRGVPQWYGSAEHEQGYNDRDDESIGMRHRGSHSQSMKDRRDESKGMTGSLHAHHPYADVSTMMAEGWEHFEAMEVFPPSYDGDLANSMSRIKEKYPRAQVKSGTRPIYLTKRQGSMNRFHFFIETSVGNFNVYGRIGYPKPQVYGPMTSGIYSDKMRTKIRKGYKKNAETFENPMIDQGYYPNTYGESSAVISGNGVPQWYGSAENIVIDKPIQTGAKLGLGFILMSAGVTIASVFTGMLLGE